MLQLLEAVNHLRVHGVVHRSLRPENVFIWTGDSSRQEEETEEEKEEEEGFGRANRASAEEDKASGGAEVLDIIDVEGMEPVKGEVEEKEQQEREERGKADEAEKVANVKPDHAVEARQDQSAKEGSGSDEDLYYPQVRVGNFSESIQVTKLPYSSRYLPISCSALAIERQLSHDCAQGLFLWALLRQASTLRLRWSGYKACGHCLGVSTIAQSMLTHPSRHGQARALWSTIASRTCGRLV